MNEYTPSRNISTSGFFNLFSLTLWQFYSNKISVYLSIYIYVYISVYLSLYIYVCIYIYINVYIYIYVHIYTYIYIYICTYVCVCVCIYIYIMYIYTSGQKWSTTTECSNLTEARWVYVRHVHKCMSCHKAIVVITRRAYCFHDWIYIYNIYTYI